MSAQFTDDDVGKRVIDANGEIVGIVTAIEHGSARVEPNPGIIDRIKAKLGWEDVDREAYPLQEAAIDRVTDEEIRLKAELAGTSSSGADAEAARDPDATVEGNDNRREESLQEDSGRESTDSRSIDERATIGQESAPDGDVSEAETGRVGLDEDTDPSETELADPLEPDHEDQRAGPTSVDEDGARGMATDGDVDSDDDTGITGDSDEAVFEESRTERDRESMRDLGDDDDDREDRDEDV